MAGNFPTIYCCEGPVYAAYRARPERACWGKGDRSVTRPADSFLRGATLSFIG